MDCPWPEKVAFATNGEARTALSALPLPHSAQVYWCEAGHWHVGTLGLGPRIRKALGPGMVRPRRR